MLSIIEVGAPGAKIKKMHFTSWKWPFAYRSSLGSKSKVDLIAEDIRVEYVFKLVNKGKSKNSSLLLKTKMGPR